MEDGVEILIRCDVVILKLDFTSGRKFIHFLLILYKNRFLAGILILYCVILWS